jgi:hypothetical protein
MLLWLSTAWAGVTLVNTAPLVADGQGVAVVHMHVEGLGDGDSLKLKPFEGELLDTERHGEAVTLTLRPPEVYKPGQMRIAVKARGGVKVTEDLVVPLIPPSRAGLEISTKRDGWKAGDRRPFELTIQPGEGFHELPTEARRYAVRASQGSVGPLEEGKDGAWSFSWTPPSKPEAETHLVFAVVDTTRPEQGRAIKTLSIEGAPEGSQPPLLIAPVAGGSKLPRAQTLEVWVAAPQGGTPTIEGAEGSPQGGGWTRFSVVSPAEGTTWTLTTTAGEATDSLKTGLVSGLPTVTLRSDPPTLGENTRSLKVTATVVDGQGGAMVKQRMAFSADKLSPSGGYRDNRDGTYTQAYTVSSKVDRARVTASVRSSATGSPVARLVAWAPEPTLLADGSSKATVTVVAVDALGMPVPSVKLELKAPLGDGTLKPSATTDSNGLAVVEYVAGTTPGPVRVEATTAEGVLAEAVLWQREAGEGPWPLIPSGDADVRAFQSTWRSAVASVQLQRIDGKVGLPARMAVSSTPEFTTPGAAVLVSVRIQDAAGMPVAGRKLKVTTSAGSVGAVSDNGDGSYLIPVQLAAGKDGPMDISVTTGGLSEKVWVPSLESLGGVAAVNADGTVKDKPQDVASASTGGASAGRGEASEGASLMMVRVTGVDMAYDVEVRSPGGASAPVRTNTGRALPLGVAATSVQLELFPTRGRLGGAVDTRLGGWRMGWTNGVEDETTVAWVYPTAFEARFRQPLGDSPLRLHLGAGAEVTNAVMFQYVNDLHAAVEPVSASVWGARLSLGMELDTRLVDLRLQAAEAFGPLPIASHVGGALDLGVLPGPMFLSLTGDADWQHFTVPAEGSGELVLRGRQLAIGAGVGARF